MSFKDETAQLATQLDSIIRTAERVRGDLRTVTQWTNMAVIDVEVHLSGLVSDAKDVRDGFDAALRTARAEADRRQRVLDDALLASKRPL